MLKVTIKLLPQGYSVNSKILKEMYIINDGTGDVDIGNYIYGIFRRRSKRVLREGRIENFHRRRDNELKLLYLVLKDIYD